MNISGTESKSSLVSFDERHQYSMDLVRQRVSKEGEMSEASSFPQDFGDDWK